MKPTLATQPQRPVTITVLGFVGRSWIDRFIMRLLGRPSHTVVQFNGNNDILDVRPDFKLDWTIYGPSYLYWNAPVIRATYYDVPRHAVTKMLEWVEQHKGAKYDIRGAVGLVLPWFKNLSDSFYCSNMTAAFLHAGGLLPVLMTRISPRQLFVTMKAISAAVITEPA